MNNHFDLIITHVAWWILEETPDTPNHTERTKLASNVIKDKPLSEESIERMLKDCWNTLRIQRTIPPVTSNVKANATPKE